MWYLALLTGVLAWLLTGIGLGDDPLAAFNAKRVLLCVLLIVGAGAALHRGQRARAVWLFFGLDLRVRRLALTALAAGLAASLGASSPVVALQEVALFVLVFWAILLAAGRVSAERALPWLTAMALAVVIYWVHTLFGILAAIPIKDAKPFLALGGYGHPRFMNQVQAFLLPFLLLFWTTRGSSSQRVWFLFGRVSSVLYASLIYISAGRGIVLAMLAGAAVCAWLLGREGRRMATAFVLVLALGLGLYFLVEQVPYYLHHGHWDTYNAAARLGDGSRGRVILWGAALNAVAEHPLLGLGPQHYILNSPGPAHPHNSVLQLVSEWGLVGGFALVGLLGSLVLAAANAARDPGRKASPDAQLLAATVFALVAGLSYSLLSGVLVMPHAQLTFVVVAGFVLGRFEPVPVEKRAVYTWPSRLLVTTVLVAAGILAWSSARDLVQYPEIHQSGSPRAYPRFWVNADWPRYGSGASTEQPAVDGPLSR